MKFEAGVLTELDNTIRKIMSDVIYKYIYMWVFVLYFADFSLFVYLHIHIIYIYSVCIAFDVASTYHLKHIMTFALISSGREHNQ